MKAFLTKSALFILLQVMLFAFFWNPSMPYEHNYLAATIDKHHRLKTTRSPRLILVGGSNLAFGIKSAILENELGRPLVNMGLNAHLGIPFMLDEVEGEIGPGDSVVLSLEYDIFSPPARDVLAAQMLEVRPAAYPFYAGEWKRLIDEYGLSIVGGIARRSLLLRFTSDPVVRSGTSYKRDFFDAQGSYTGHYGKPSTHPRLDRVEDPKFAESVRARIERFVQLCKERGARCFYSCPPYPLPLLAPVRAKIEANIEQLRRIPNLIVLDSPCDQQYGTNLFYDTCYHLTEEGADQRTRKLVCELRPHLAR